MPIGKSCRKRCTTIRDKPKGIVGALDKKDKQANENVDEVKVFNDEINTTDFSENNIVFLNDKITDAGEVLIDAYYNNNNDINFITVITPNIDQHGEGIKYNLRRNPKKIRLSSEYILDTPILQETEISQL